jgi:hypothetical protein
MNFTTSDLDLSREMLLVYVITHSRYHAVSIFLINERESKKLKHCNRNKNENFIVVQKSQRRRKGICCVQFIQLAVFMVAPNFA